MRTFLLADLAIRALELAGHSITLVQNITDVGHMSENIDAEIIGEQDKVVEEGHRQSMTALEIAAKYEALFHQDLALLNIRPADHYPRASASMDLIISAIEKLVAVNAAYVGSDGNVYFDAQSFESYGAISGNKIDQLKPGHRYEYTDEGGKRFHADWALWKVAGERTEMVWDSPWGRGFPGWHIECSAMSLDLLGAEIDLHIGGIDLRFPHHENERAQTNSVTGLETVKLWVHGEHLLFEGRKMAKSSGNVVLLSDIASRGFDPLSLRFCLLENRYRSQMDLTWDSVEAANATLKRWRRSGLGQSKEARIDVEILTAFENDLDTPRVMQRLRSVEKDQQLTTAEKAAIFSYADQVLGLDLDREVVAPELSIELAQLLADRDLARSSKNWGESDRIRIELESAGLIINDTADGQEWEMR
jgi:cysteinyl-tRNA synthetase